MEQTQELRVRGVPVSLHKKIKRYVAAAQLQGREINKGTATIELLAKATKDIKL